MINRLIKRKIATAVLVSASLAAFATLGDGGKKTQQKSLLLTPNTSTLYKNFSLKSNFNYRGNNIFSTNTSSKFIMLNTVVTYQKGNATFILPMKRKVFLDKIKFNTTQ